MRAAAFRLAPESPLELAAQLLGSIVGEVDELDRHLAVELRVVGEQDPAHAAAPDLALDPVAADGGGEGHTPFRGGCGRRLCRRGGHRVQGVEGSCRRIPAVEAALAANVLAVSGWSGSGKTTCLVAAARQLEAEGLRVAVVKSSHHPAPASEGGDAERLAAVASTVVLHTAGGEIAWRRGERPLARELRALARRHDLVLVEGAKGSDLPKVWLEGPNGEPPPEGIGRVLETVPWQADRVAAVLVRAHSAAARAWAERPILGGLLVGGRSSRMGRPKQRLVSDGRTFLQIAYDALAPHVGRLVLLGGEGDGERLPDVAGIGGPLAGLLAAVRWEPEAAWVVCACDLPRVTPRAVAWLLAQRRPGRWVVMPSTPDGPQPLLAIYEPPSFAALERLAPRQGPHRLAEHEWARPVPVPGDLIAEWANVNRPEDLQGLPS
jgi:molybdopterin-guanine dinucleotide biosynthesis protein MobB